MLVTQYNELIDAASAARLRAYAPYSGFSAPNMKILAATIDGQVQEFELAELLPLPSQGILEGSRDV